MDVVVRSYSHNHIDVDIDSEFQGGWRFSGIYGYPEEGNKMGTGLLLKRLWDNHDGPWICGGDFNLMLQSSEKAGGREFCDDEAEILREAITYCNLEDLGYIGHDFTWTNNRGGTENIQEHLDRFLANRAWRECFPGSFVSHLTKRRSNHLPILLCIKEALELPKKKKKKKLYRFEEMLSAWSRQKFGDFINELHACRSQIEKLMNEAQTEEVISQMKTIDDRIDELERREEMYWKQRSRQDWLQHGDKNTTFFHTKTKQRAERNNIKKIKDEAGNEFDDEEKITEVFVNYFEGMFTGNSHIEPDPVIEKSIVSFLLERQRKRLNMCWGFFLLMRWHMSILDGIEKLCRQFFWGQKGEERKLCLIAWNKLYLPKKEGGLGFRNMRNFNRSLLGKQAWRILTNEDSLVARVLKGKYYPHSSLMEAKVYSNSSYTWRSIMGARDVLWKGARKPVGNGSTVHIWKDPWVPTLPDFKVFSSSRDNGEGPTFVRDLWANNSWNNAALSLLFSPTEIKEICNIPVPLYDRKDVWDKNGTATSSRASCNFKWSVVWNSDNTPKVKHFAWRAIKGAVDARQSLIQRGMNIDPICPMCGIENESVMHMLALCPDAKRIWYLSPLRLEVGKYEGLEFGEWCGSICLHHRDPHWWNIFLAILWGIWLWRNMWCYEKRRKDMMDVIHKAVSMVGDYEQAQQDMTSRVGIYAKVQCILQPNR
uniref:Reverse transcriptase zinc-binding domain-containing protein n=1 Tax=Chenopodium quinoa TaxID=63459 RepID=A0A803L0F3_CHEQI